MIQSLKEKEENVSKTLVRISRAREEINVQFARESDDESTIWTHLGLYLIDLVCSNINVQFVRESDDESTIWNHLGF